MRLFKIIASFLLISGVIALMVWASIISKNETCKEIFIVINTQKEPQLVSVLNIFNILEQHNIEWKGKKKEEIDLAFIHKILAKENYIKSVDKVLLLGSKLQIEVTLYEILLEIQPKTGDSFLVDVDGICLPYSPNTSSDIIIANGIISNTFLHKQRITQENKELYEIFSVASLIKEDPFYTALFHRLEINDKQEIVLQPSIGKLPVLFGTLQDAENKLKALKYMYAEALPYMNDDKYSQLDVRFKNRIIAKKTKS